jgi:hypothetical protein
VTGLRKQAIYEWVVCSTEKPPTNPLSIFPSYSRFFQAFNNSDMKKRSKRKKDEEESDTQTDDEPNLNQDVSGLLNLCK